VQCDPLEQLDLESNECSCGAPLALALAPSLHRVRAPQELEKEGDMRTCPAKACVALAIGAALASLSSSASAAENMPNSLNAPPTGPGTETPPGTRAGVRPGFEGGVGIGTGFSDTYGLGLQARVGYTFQSGVYAGGAISYYIGHSVNDQSAHATFLGGELGYKIFANRRLEIRPYVFMGPAFITEVNSNPFFTNSHTDFAIQPGGQITYHIGNAFIGGDARWLVTPSPNTLAILASGGLGF